MSKELGPQQRRLVAWAGRFRGIPVAYVAEDLCLSERRARKVIESLCDRGQVIVVNDPWTRQRRVFTPEAHRTWVRAQKKADHVREQAMLWPEGRTAQRVETAR